MATCITHWKGGGLGHEAARWAFRNSPYEKERRSQVEKSCRNLTMTSDTSE